MGTPDFSVPCLQRLIDDGHEITGVFTQPDKPKGRHGVLTPPPVKELALKYGIEVFQPVKMRDGTALEMLKKAAPELVIVVAYGKILPSEILHWPQYGCINIHASLLPELRGAAPIQWAILSGLKKTGVTSMQMDEGLDTGDMLLKGEIEIDDDMDAETLHDELSRMGASVMHDTIEQLIKGELKPVKQQGESTYASMLSKDISPVDWSKTAREVHNHIRGLYSWPCASAGLDGKRVKLLKSRLADVKGKAPGEIIIDGGRMFAVCGDLNAVEILVIQAENKKAMNVADYLRGNPVETLKFE